MFDGTLHEQQTEFHFGKIWIMQQLYFIIFPQFSIYQNVLNELR